MWRWIKAGFLAVLALVLLSIGLANRDLVELRLMYTEISAFAGFNYSITLPLYLIVFLCIGFGVMIGFIWAILVSRSRRFGVNPPPARQATKLTTMRPATTR